MEPVITVNLNGAAYQLETTAHDALRAYLDSAEDALGDNPDRTEILRDLEQAIAEKCASYLSAHKNVVSGAEMANILKEMGPVQGATDEAEGAEGASSDAAPRKRLYRIKDGAMISGVCAGLGAYFSIDPTFIRFAMVILTFVTGGWMVLFYILAMFLVPSAHTSQEWAAAHGVPFNAQEVIDRAKREYRDFTKDAFVHVKWRAWDRAVNERTRGWTRSFHSQPSAAPVAAGNYLTRVLAGILALVFGLISAAMLIAYLVVIWSLFTTQTILGFPLPLGVPFWLAIVIVSIVYAAIGAPISMIQRSSTSALTGHPHGHDHAGGVLVILALVFGGWYAYAHVPEARVWMDQVAAYFSAWSHNWNIRID